MTNFDSQLHEDLFDLFILAFREKDFTPFEVSEYNFQYEQKFGMLQRQFKQLFPLENHPEQYERYMSDGHLRYMRLGGGCEAYDKDNYFENKITITVEQE